jgi:hypothetical protein
MVYLEKSSSVRPGKVVVFVAFALMVVLGFAAISLDGGLLLQDRRAAQAAADTAALAAAAELFAESQTNQGLDPSGTAAQKALNVAAANGYNNDQTSSRVTVNIPPQSGMHAGQSGHAEVIIEYYRGRFFSSIWDSSAITVRARAVARGQWAAFHTGILILDPTSPGSLTDNGGGTATVVNADVIVDSNAPNAAISTGGGQVSAPNFYITGVPGTSTSGGGTFTGNIIDNQPPTPDPLAYLPAPDPTTMVVQSNNATNYAGTQTVSIQPGVYTGGIHVSGQVTLNMAPGIYYMDGGGFSFTGQGNLNATGVMIYTAPQSNSDNININGLGQINFSPPTTGLYRGITLWQQRSSTNTISLNGNGTSTMYGTFYAQHGTLAVSGNGASDVIGSQYISYDLTLGGNGNYLVIWRPDLTAPTRSIYLVE